MAPHHPAGVRKGLEAQAAAVGAVARLAHAPKGDAVGDGVHEGFVHHGVPRLDAFQQLFGVFGRRGEHVRRQRLVVDGVDELHGVAAAPAARPAERQHRQHRPKDFVGHEGGGGGQVVDDGGGHVA